MKIGYVIFWLVARLLRLVWIRKIISKYQRICVYSTNACDILCDNHTRILQDDYNKFVHRGLTSTHRCLQETCHDWVYNDFLIFFSCINAWKRSLNCHLVINFKVLPWKSSNSKRWYSLLITFWNALSLLCGFCQ